ncbi:MAG: TolB family protein [Cellulomonas sp.]|jgi:TolB protein|uniref:TolB family protein n=1 Tax=Cellulomonas sp. TaxID=40001 RepID=UPI001A0369E9|nr:biopolymer transporter Tol [Cellulomonas sp.]MBF0687928.1 TolB family protein [Cellulomonas sp.]
MPPRALRAGQRAELHVIDVVTGEDRLVHESSSLLFEAPNWSPDGRWLVVNGGGRLFRLPADGGELEEVPLGDVPEINNDHVLSPDGATVYVSAEDGHLYAVPFEGGGAPRRVSNDRGAFRHYLHGISPDGATLAYIGLVQHADGTATTNVWTIPAAGGPDVQLTDDEFPDDGAEFSPDGRWVLFNSERARTEPGHAQLFRMRTDGSSVEQLTFDERVNWFPHVSPDGSRLAYISFPRGTLGHPADLDVVLRLLEPYDADGAPGTVRDLVVLFGGQGTINVPSWASDSRRLAYVAYPMS